MKKLITSFDEMIGQRYERLIVLAMFRERGMKDTRAVCRCDCGKIIIPKARNVKTGITSSCGCLSRDKRKLSRNNNGWGHTRIYQSWRGMIQRCYLPKTYGFKHYGGRGITVCEEWITDFHSFRKWAERSGYDETLEIDRIDNNGEYSPENCKWSTRLEQMNNRRCTLTVLFNGEKTTLSEACRITGMRYGKALYRKKSGFQDSDIFKENKMEKRSPGNFKTHSWRNVV